MIKNLLIRNYALIRELEMAPSPRFNTITGETGAGKSIMLGALGLLLGNRADTRVLFDEGKKCIIEGVFDVSNYRISSLFAQYELDYADETIIRREINPSGKSRAFINDTPVTLDVMKAIGSFLVDVHSQRDTYLLGSPSYQLHIIDGYAQNSRFLMEYQAIYKEYKKLRSSFLTLKEKAEELRKEADYNHFLLEELEQLDLQEGEQEVLEEELQVIEHAEDIKTKLFECQQLLEQSEYAVNPALQQVLKNMEAISEYSAHFESLRERLESCLYELKDIAKEMESESRQVEFDKGRQEEIQQRLAVIFQLLQKHHAKNGDDLIALRKELREKVNRVITLDDDLKAAEDAMKNKEKSLMKAAARLSEARKAVVDDFKQKLQMLLAELAMPHATIRFSHESISPNLHGIDQYNILFSANAGITPSELKNVASGGEFSRLMFAVKYLLAGKTSLPTIVFDEIDAGISGEVAIKMVKMMREMAQRHQVIAITHLPQIAASGDAHYLVFKEHENGRSFTRIRKLAETEREVEIAKMIGGENPTEVTLQNARELLGRS